MRMPSADQNVFLLDVDNTLLDNDRAQDEYLRYIAQECGPEAAARYWDIFQQLVAELGYADYLAALQRYRLEDSHPRGDQAAVGRAGDDSLCTAGSLRA